MCLTLTDTSRKDTLNLIKSHRKSKKPIIAYKIFAIDPQNNLDSPYRQNQRKMMN